MLPFLWRKVKPRFFGNSICNYFFVKEGLAVKKLISIVLVVVLLCSCNPKDDLTKDGQTDAEREYGYVATDNAIKIEEAINDHDSDLGMIFSGRNDMGLVSICETETAYYFAHLGVLYSCDKETKISKALCQNEKCEHNDEACSAYIEYINGNISSYSGKLWWLTKDSIYCCDYDGSDRQLVRQIDSEHTSVVAFHRGYMYMDITDGSDFAVKRYDINSSSDEQVIINQGEYGSFVPFEDTIYIATREGSTRTLYRFDTLTSDLETLYSGEFAVDVDRFCVSNEGELYFSGDEGAYKFDLTAKSFDLSVRLKSLDPCDESFYNELFFDENVIVANDVNSFNANFETVYKIFDYSGNMIGKAVFKDIEGFEIPSTQNWMANYLGSGSEELFWRIRFHSGNDYTAGTPNETYHFIVAFPKYGDREPRVIYSYHNIYQGNTAIG